MAKRAVRWGLIIALACRMAAPAIAQVPCATGATCKKVDEKGNAVASAAYVAQCSGKYPDYVDKVPTPWTGDRFKLSQSYPTQLPTGGPTPWQQHDFMKAVEVDAYLLAVRGYVYDGMLQADWRAEKNTVRQWYHVPWMTLRPNTNSPLPREFLRGMTQERGLRDQELGLKPNRKAENWAIGYYNDVGGYTIGKVWNDPTNPKAAESQFPVGTVVVKVLFSAAKPDDFTGGDILAGAPEWDANISGTGTTKVVKKVRLLQMDVAVRDARAPTTGWVFGTFAYDRNAPGATGWDKMIPVGLMWGNDPDVDETGGGVMDEGFVSASIPAYAKAHLGAQGRVNGPVDNPASACMSCHSTAEAPSSAPMINTSPDCDATERKVWFRDFSGSTPFGDVDRLTCALSAGTPPPTALDYSLQMAVALRAFHTPGLVNPCSVGPNAPAVPVGAPIPAAAAHVTTGAPAADPGKYDVVR